jgi:pilus assembly protein Flp/PilA
VFSARGKKSPLWFHLRLGLAGRREGFAVRDTFRRFWHDEAGATSIEYALIASIISIAIITGAITLGNKLNSTFDYVSTLVKTS